MEKVETPKAVPPFDFAQDGTAFGVSSLTASDIQRFALI
jgi:hypothetical protein